jgi:hypothetical protein
MKDLKNERLIKLNEAFKKLESGTIDNETLQNAVKLSREIYEQWIIVQHEFQFEEEDPIVDSFKNTFKQKEIDTKIVEEIPVSELVQNEKEAIRIAENQTTLIEIIDEIQEDQSINERISQGKSKESLAQKHAKKAITDIDKSIGLNQRFSFIKNLFENDKSAYNEAVLKLNSCASFIEADDYIHNVLIDKFKWDENTVHVIKFIELIERRYLV